MDIKDKLKELSKDELSQLYLDMLKELKNSEQKIDYWKNSFYILLGLIVIIIGSMIANS